MSDPAHATAFMAVVFAGLGFAVIRSAPPAHADQPRDGIAVYALSKGRGVPPETAKALQKVRAVLQRLEREHKSGGVMETRIGLEGETRLCAEITDAETARTTLDRLRELTRGVDLLNVVEEPCRKGN